MTIFRGFAILLGLAVAAPACVPKRVSDECQRRVSACLKDCPAHPASDQEMIDSRNACERACQQQCQ